MNIQNQRLYQLIEQATANDLRAPNVELNKDIIKEINSRADM